MYQLQKLHHWQHMRWATVTLQLETLEEITVSCQQAGVKVFVLTELIKVCLHAVGPRHRADEPGLQERAPLVDQTAVSSIIVLFFYEGGVKTKHSFFISSMLLSLPL